MAQPTAELRTLAGSQEAAWLGLLKAHTELTRGLDAELARLHGLSLATYELLCSLAQADDGHLRMSLLAEGSQLSLSRVSRVVDQLEARGLAARTACPGDSRVVHVTITPTGRRLVTDAQETFFSVIEERFLGRLSCDEVELLGSVFGRLVEMGPPAEPGSGDHS